MSNKSMIRTKKENKHKKENNAVFLSNSAFWIMACLCFLLGPINLLIFLGHVDFSSYNAMSAVGWAMWIYTAVVLFIGGGPSFVAIILNITALVKSQGLSVADKRKVRWRSGGSLLVIPATLLVLLIMSCIGSSGVVFLELIEMVALVAIMMSFFIIPLIVTRQCNSNC